MNQTHMPSRRAETYPPHGWRTGMVIPALRGTAGGDRCPRPTERPGGDRSLSPSGRDGGRHSRPSHVSALQNGDGPGAWFRKRTAGALIASNAKRE